MKTLPLGLHEQNMVLYAGGSALNLLGHTFKRLPTPTAFSWQQCAVGLRCARQCLLWSGCEAAMALH